MTATAVACLHCATAFMGEGDFCCSGCRFVYRLLHRDGLERFYDLRGPRGVPIAEARAERADHAWIEGLRGQRAVSLDVQGIHCAACVWLIETLFRRQPGGVEIVINPALGTLELLAEPGFDLGAFVGAVEPCGYRLGPALKGREPVRDGADSLLLRMGVCVAIAMNSMIFAIALYAGLPRGPLHDAFLDINFVLSALSVLVGGSVFFRSAWNGLRRGVLHLDLPIAVGIALAFGSSAVAFLGRRGDAAYFDTLNVFIALMLVGRFLQDRVLVRNRRALLSSAEADGLLTRIVADGRARTVRCAEVRAGDTLLLAPGDLVPVEAELQAERAELSLDWVNGEPAPRSFARGETLPAGSFHAGASAITAAARSDFSASSLLPLLRRTRTREADAARATPWWRRLARVYVAAVLGIAATAFVFWLAHGGGAGRALEVTAAILIVTCPCAFGIATPLAYELVQAGLRRAGLFVRSAGFLDRAQDVTQVVFDKTGTLTTGTLRLLDEAPLAALAPAERRALYDMVARSAHPKSVAIRRALELDDVRLSSAAAVVEEPGVGLTLVQDGAAHTLRADGDAVVYAVDGRPRARLQVSEDLRPDAAAEIAGLAAAGYTVHVLSGDVPERVRALAVSVGVPSERAHGGHSPEAKAAWLAAHDRGDVLMVGDGLNDGLVVDRATCSGTPAVDRPFMPARSDFTFVTPGLRPVRLALAAAGALRRATRRNLIVAVAYNAVAVSLACAGLMSPLVAAVIMPLSSLSVVTATVLAVGPRSALWKS